MLDLLGLRLCSIQLCRCGWSGSSAGLCGRSAWLPVAGVPGQLIIATLYHDEARPPGLVLLHLTSAEPVITAGGLAGEAFYSSESAAAYRFESLPQKRVRVWGHHCAAKYIAMYTLNSGLIRG